MRNISFQLTTEQVRNRTKTVTRRLGWEKLQPGELLQACVKCMGLRPGEKVEKLCVIRVKSVTLEPLSAITPREVTAEGFPFLSRRGFVQMFCQHMRCDPSQHVRRIEFEYVPSMTDER